LPITTNERRSRTWPTAYDSLDLSRAAANTDAQVIVFYGVQFMAETAAMMAHPECSLDVLNAVDKVAGTSGMLRYAEESAGKEFVVGTESGMVYRFVMCVQDCF